ncbi:MAG: hypothetical protein KGI06_05090 [Candidatus Micrarchaeota archaeon]|nr:hypothetical protein [Candidatus Micrarchaeota archaeon]
MVTIGFDLDGTFTDTWRPMLLLMERRHGIKASKEEIRHHELTENEPFRRLTREQATVAFEDVWRDYRSIPLEHPRIPEMVRDFRRTYGRILQVTSTVADRKTIHSYLDYRGITGIDSIFWCRDPKEKTRSGVDVIVDDNHVVIEAFANAGLGAVLLAQPWNEDFRNANRGNPNFAVAMNWPELPDILMGIAKGRKSNGNGDLSGLSRR